MAFSAVGDSTGCPLVGSWRMMNEAPAAADSAEAPPPGLPDGSRATQRLGHCEASFAFIEIFGGNLDTEEAPLDTARWECAWLSPCPREAQGGQAKRH